MIRILFQMVFNYDPTADSSEQLKIVLVVEIVKVSLHRAFGTRYLINPS